MVKYLHRMYMQAITAIEAKTRNLQTGIQTGEEIRGKWSTKGTLWPLKKRLGRTLERIHTEIFGYSRLSFHSLPDNPNGTERSHE